MPYENMLSILARGTPPPPYDYMETYINALNAAKGIQDIRMAPEKLALDRERVNIAKGHLGLEEQRYGDIRKLLPLKSAESWYNYINEKMGSIGLGTWDKERELAPEEVRRNIPTSQDFKEAMARKGITGNEDILEEVFRNDILPKYVSTTQKNKQEEDEIRKITALAHLANARRQGEGKYELLVNPITKEQREVLTGSPEVNMLLGNGWIKYEKPTASEVKPTNMPAWYDALGVEIMKSQYDTTEGKKQFADWIGDPKNREFIYKYQQEYTKRNTAPAYTVFPGGTGPEMFQTRGPGAGVIPPGRGAKMPSETLTRLADTKNIIGTMDILEQMASDPKMSKRFGPFEGRFTKVKQMFVEDGPTQEMMNNIESLIRMAYALSGKQISHQEMEILKSAMLPQLNQPHLNFMATLKTARRWMESSYNDLLDTYTKSGYSTNLTPIQKQPVPSVSGERKTIGNKSYIKINGKWYEE